MLPRSVLRSSKSAKECCRCIQKRGYAASASSFNFELSESAGTKLVSRNVPSPVSTLALVSKAGTRSQWVPGLAEGLANFAFRNTEKRFAVRIVRETELLGSEIFSARTREAVLYGAKFLREDLPYFTELLAEVASETKYQEHMLEEVIKPVLSHAHKQFLADPIQIAKNAVHGLAFHRGLGTPIYSSSLVPPYQGLQAAEIEAYAAVAYAKPNFTLVASGVDQAELSKWAGEFFGSVSSSAPSGLPGLTAEPSKYYGGEERIAHSKNAIVIGFQGTGLASGSGYKPEYEVLSTLLGGETSIKWSHGTSVVSKAIASHIGVSAKTETVKYADTGLVLVTLTGPAKALTAAAKDVVSGIKSFSQGSIPKDDLKKAIAQAKFKTYAAETADAPALDLIGLSALANGKVQSYEESLKGITSVSEAAVQEAAKNLFSKKVSIATVGQLQDLPFAEDLGLNA